MKNHAFELRIGRPDGYWQVYMILGSRAYCWSFRAGFQKGDAPGTMERRIFGEEVA